ncbi:alpha-mannosidase-like [Phalaenopsis equestris]|uniref:alpha-mannosidase-like n=1 Tax=Phalaenopsis equestris TaxID=78828 RepID=UPI0009E2B1A6|nr:alpha-mannosidase-like [Phalaenopsis equestris]
MHDEAAAHYIDMIDQTTLGHRLIKKQFNHVPRVGWQIDPFGHSAVQGYLLGAELGFDSVFFARIDYQDRIKRTADKSLEVIWRGSRTLGRSSQIFASAFPVDYSPPQGFHFEVNDFDPPVQDDPHLYDYNVNERVNDFINAALVQANVTRTNHIMWTMGDDFQYQYAESWFKEMDKLINYVNEDGRIHALYSTPSIYTDAKYASNEAWPLKTDDYFPYANAPNAYFTGYYTSRPTFKRFVRVLSAYYLAARQLEFLVGRKHSGPLTFPLGEALAVAQHHDAISGTSLLHVTNDYTKRLAYGASQAEMVIDLAIPCLSIPTEKCASNSSSIKLSQCNLVNISYCPSTEEISNGKNLVMVVYNSLGWNRTEYIRVPVDDNQIVVRDANGNFVETQVIEMDNTTKEIRNFYVKAYLGEQPKDSPKFWLVFKVLVPPLGWNTYYISKATRKEGNNSNCFTSTISAPDNETVEIGPGSLKIAFSPTTGKLERMVNYRTGVDLYVQQNYLWYGSSPGDKEDSQASHAYIFRPDGSPPTAASGLVSMKIVRGPLVDEVHQQFNSWINQVTRIYKDKENVEFEYTIGPVPTDGVGKEVITRLATTMVTNRTFHTDSNGRDFLKRVRDHRDDWNLTVNQPVAGNYYPINLGMYIEDENYELSILVDRACGGSSIQDGQLEIMLHRRILDVEGSFLGEALNETVCVDDVCRGLTVRGNYYMNINRLGSGAQWRRTNGQQIYSPVLLAFTYEDERNWKSTQITKATSMDPGYSLPPNVALITLEELDDGTVLLRLAHLYEAGEDALNSALAKVELKKIFAHKMIKELKETSLSANQDKSEMKKLNWRAEGDSGDNPAPVRGGPVNNSTLIVELGPLEIRTFLLRF